MTPANATPVLLLLSFAAAVSAREPVQTSIARPYYDCVESAAIRYARKSDDIDAVIEAAKASCLEKRDDLLATIVADVIVKGNPRDPEHAGRRTMDYLESEWRPDLVKSILDAR